MLRAVLLRNKSEPLDVEHINEIDDFVLKNLPLNIAESYWNVLKREEPHKTVSLLLKDFNHVLLQSLCTYSLVALEPSKKLGLKCASALEEVLYRPTSQSRLSFLASLCNQGEFSSPYFSDLDRFLKQHLVAEDAVQLELEYADCKETFPTLAAIIKMEEAWSFDNAEGAENVYGLAENILLAYRVLLKDLSFLSNVVLQTKGIEGRQVELKGKDLPSTIIYYQDSHEIKLLLYGECAACQDLIQIVPNIGERSEVVFFEGLIGRDNAHFSNSKFNLAIDRYDIKFEGLVERIHDRFNALINVRGDAQLRQSYDELRQNCQHYCWQIYRDFKEAGKYNPRLYQQPSEMEGWLERFVASEQQLCIVCGEQGRGKSALLCHWMSHFYQFEEEANNEESEDNALLFLEAHRLNVYEEPYPDLLERWIKASLNIDDNEDLFSFLKKTLINSKEERKLLVFIDAINEFEVLCGSRDLWDRKRLLQEILLFADQLAQDEVLAEHVKILITLRWELFDDEGISADDFEASQHECDRASRFFAPAEQLVNNVPLPTNSERLFKDIQSANIGMSPSFNWTEIPNAIKRACANPMVMQLFMRVYDNKEATSIDVETEEQLEQRFIETFFLDSWTDSEEIAEKKEDHRAIVRMIMMAMANQRTMHVNLDLSKADGPLEKLVCNKILFRQRLLIDGNLAEHPYEELVTSNILREEYVRPGPIRRVSFMHELVARFLLEYADQLEHNVNIVPLFNTVKAWLNTSLYVFPALVMLTWVIISWSSPSWFLAGPLEWSLSNIEFISNYDKFVEFAPYAALLILAIPVLLFFYALPQMVEAAIAKFHQFWSRWINSVVRKRFGALELFSVYEVAEAKSRANRMGYIIWRSVILCTLTAICYVFLLGLPTGGLPEDAIHRTQLMIVSFIFLCYLPLRLLPFFLELTFSRNRQVLKSYSYGRGFLTSVAKNHFGLFLLFLVPMFINITVNYLSSFKEAFLIAPYLDAVRQCFLFSYPWCALFPLFLPLLFLWYPIVGTLTSQLVRFVQSQYRQSWMPYRARRRLRANLGLVVPLCAVFVTFLPFFISPPYRRPFKAAASYVTGFHGFNGKAPKTLFEECSEIRQGDVKKDIENEANGSQRDLANVLWLENKEGPEIDKIAAVKTLIINGGEVKGSITHPSVRNLAVLNCKLNASLSVLFPNVQCLYLSGEGITSLHDFASMKGLQILYLVETLVTDLRPLRMCAKLRKLEVVATPAFDFDVLAMNEFLNTIVCRCSNRMTKGYGSLQSKLEKPFFADDASLYLEGDGVFKIPTFIKRNKTIRKVLLVNTSIRQISKSAILEKVQSLMLDDNELNDYRDLIAFPELKKLALRKVECQNLTVDKTQKSGMPVEIRSRLRSLAIEEGQYLHKLDLTFYPELRRLELSGPEPGKFLAHPSSQMRGRYSDRYQEKYRTLYNSTLNELPQLRTLRLRDCIVDDMHGYIILPSLQTMILENVEASGFSMFSSLRRLAIVAHLNGGKVWID